MGIFEHLKESAKEKLEELSISIDEIDHFFDSFKTKLEQAITKVIDELGKPGGFLDHEDVRIRIGDKEDNEAEKEVQKAVGNKSKIRQLIVAMNETAEQSVFLASDVLAKTATGIQAEDIRDLVKKSKDEDAVTEWLRDKSTQPLFEVMHPHIEKLLNKTPGVKIYNFFHEHAILPTTKYIFRRDLDELVTNKAIKGLFKRIADEEKLWRKDPEQRIQYYLQKITEFSESN